MSDTGDRIKQRLFAANIHFAGDVEDLLVGAGTNAPVLIKGPAAVVDQVRRIVDEERKVA